VTSQKVSNHRALRTDLAQTLRSRPAPTVPPPERILEAAQALDRQDREDGDEEQDASPRPEMET
jgi:hypothetical protein